MKKFAFVVLGLFIGAVGNMMAQQPPVGQGELANPLEPNKARPRIYVGPVAGYNRSLHSSGFQSVSGDVLCPDFTSGTANGYYLGVSAEYMLGKPSESKSSIIARVVYNYMPAYYEKPGDRLPSIDQTNGSIVYSTVRHVAEIKYSTIDLEAIYKLNLFNSNFGVVIGPTIGVPVAVSRQQRMELIEPLNAQFDPSLYPDNKFKYINNNRGIITAEDNIPDKSGIRLAIKAGVQYEMPIGKLLLVPCMYYNFGITEVSASNNLRINAIQAGVDLRFAL